MHGYILVLQDASTNALPHSICIILLSCYFCLSLFTLLDLFKKDFVNPKDDSVTVEITSAAPADTTVTTELSVSPLSDSPSISSKVALGWSHPAGFTLDKLEYAPSDKGSFTTETSLTGVMPGLKLDFKGDDSEKGELGFTYKHAAATLNGFLDLYSFSKAELAVGAGADDVTFGVKTNVTMPKKAGESVGLDFSIAGGYSIPKMAFLGCEINKGFKDYALLASYTVDPQLSVAVRVDSAPGKDKTYDTKAQVGCAYKCNATTSLKAKVDMKKDVNVSVKQALSKDCNLTAFALAPAMNFSALTFGCKFTLG